jgi:hypothetical protein
VTRSIAIWRDHTVGCFESIMLWLLIATVHVLLNGRQ